MLKDLKLTDQDIKQKMNTLELYQDTNSCLKLRKARLTHPTPKITSCRPCIFSSSDELSAAVLKQILWWETNPF